MRKFNNNFLRVCFRASIVVFAATAVIGCKAGYGSSSSSASTKSTNSVLSSAASSTISTASVVEDSTLVSQSSTASDAVATESAASVASVADSTAATAVGGTTNAQSSVTVAAINSGSSSVAVQLPSSVAISSPVVSSQASASSEQSVVSSSLSASSSPAVSLAISASAEIILEDDTLILRAAVSTADSETGTALTLSLLRNGTVVEEKTASPYEWFIPITVADNGEQVFSVEAVDGDNQHFSTEALTIIVNIPVDTEKPEVNLLTSRVSYGVGDVLVLEAKASDNDAISTVQFLRDGEVIFETADAPYTYQHLLTLENEGEAIYKAVAYDLSANSGESGSINIVTQGVTDRVLGVTVERSGDVAAAYSYFNLATPSNDLKWRSLESYRDYYSSHELISLCQIAANSSKPFRLNTQFWGDSYPSWLTRLEPDEKLAEYAQLMAKIRDNCDNIAMVDVLGYPLTIDSGAKDALDSGYSADWGWVITAFAKARRYFPDSELMMDAGRVLYMESRARQILTILEAVKEHESPDAITVSASNLERIDLDTIAANLELIASAGIPIYITDLEVNFGDDARQANVLKNLFTLFWQHPAVKGVFFSDYLQRAYSTDYKYLVKEDSSFRPAMTWLQCFHRGESDCAVDDYRAPLWTGDESAILVRADQYDSGYGVVPLGKTLAYVDDGDWVNFQRVNFEDSWNTLTINYAKQNTEPSSVSIYLDSMDGEPVVTVSLTDTGDWQSFDNVKTAWPITSGEHSVYLKFNGGSSVGNIKTIRFGKKPVEKLGENLIENPGFENGRENNWYSWYANTRVSSSHVHSGNYSLSAVNRGESGSLVRRLNGVVSSGASYRVKLFASVTGVDSAKLNITQRVSCELYKYEYNWVVFPVEVNTGEWVELEGDIHIPECSLRDVAFYIESKDTEADIYIDDLSLQQIHQSVEIYHNDFENDVTDNWSASGGELAVTPEIGLQRSKALVLSSDEESDHLKLDLSDWVTVEQDYYLDISLRIDNTSEEDIDIFNLVQLGSESEETGVVGVSRTTGDGWLFFNNFFRITNSDVNAPFLIIEKPEPEKDLIMDNVTIRQPHRELPLMFEDLLTPVNPQ